jgi:hypothetical protein
MEAKSLKAWLWHWLYFQRIFLFRRLIANFKQPDFLIVGAQRAGTTSLFNYLSQHPNIRSPLLKEIHYFDLNSQNSPDWYFAHFPPNRGNFLTGEASPYYLFHPEVPARVAKLLPTVKLIVLLRNPIERAYSNYQHSVSLGIEKRSFAEAIQPELNGQKYPVGSIAHREQSYLARGLYAEQLERWLKIFPRRQLLILKSETFFQNPPETLNAISEFLGLSSFQEAEYFGTHYNASKYPDTLSDGLRAELALYFQVSNQRLVDEIGLNIEDWT